MPDLILDILLIEDSEADAVLVREALRESAILSRLRVYNDGLWAMQFLMRAEEAELPDLILLDLNMPRVGGREVLQELKKHPRLRSIPVVVLTTSDSPEDIAESYDLQCASFVSKPPDLDQFFLMVSELIEYWGSTVRLPAARTVHQPG